MNRWHRTSRRSCIRSSADTSCPPCTRRTFPFGKPGSTRRSSRRAGSWPYRCRPPFPCRRRACPCGRDWSGDSSLPPCRRRRRRSCTPCWLRKAFRSGCSPMPRTPRHPSRTTSSPLCTGPWAGRSSAAAQALQVPLLHTLSVPHDVPFAIVAPRVGATDRGRADRRAGVTGIGGNTRQVRGAGDAGAAAADVAGSAGRPVRRVPRFEAHGRPGVADGHPDAAGIPGNHATGSRYTRPTRTGGVADHVFAARGSRRDVHRRVGARGGPARANQSALVARRWSACRFHPPRRACRHPPDRRCPRRSLSRRSDCPIRYRPKCRSCTHSRRPGRAWRLQGKAFPRRTPRRRRLDRPSHRRKHFRWF